MAAPTNKPAKTSPMGRLSKPIYTRTSVLCNGQIAWKVRRDKDMEYNKTDLLRAELRPVTDVTDDLRALNSLQIQRANPLTPIEIKQPLRHVQSALPTAIRAHIYTGDLYGSAGGVFHSCSDSDFKLRLSGIFTNETRGSGNMNYNDFFRRLRRAEWLLWDVEAEKGHWVAVIAHLYKGTMRNPYKKEFPDNPNVPATVSSFDFNKINEWCVVTARHSPEAEAMVDRVKKRLPAILGEGGISFDEGSEIYPSIWIPTNDTTWGSGLCVYNLIKTLMHRITEFYCRRLPHQKSFWSPLPGWLNLDEVRAEMQGRAAQRCMAASGYRSRIAIEGVRRYLGVKKIIRSNELRPRRRDSQAYVTGQAGKDGRCIPVGPSMPLATDSDDLTDDTEYDNYDRVHGGPVGRPPSRVAGWDEDSTDNSGMIRYVPVSKLGQQQKPESSEVVPAPQSPPKLEKQYTKKSNKKTTKKPQNKPVKGTNGDPVDQLPGSLRVQDPVTADDSHLFEHASPLKKGEKTLPEKQLKARPVASKAARRSARQAQASPFAGVPTRKSARIRKRKADEAEIKADMLEAGGIEELIKKRKRSIKSGTAGISEDEIA